MAIEERSLIWTTWPQWRSRVKEVMQCLGTSGELVMISAMKLLPILQPFPLEARISRELPRYCVIASRIMVMISAGHGQVWAEESS